MKKVLKDKGLSTAVGDEGGFAPKLESTEAALDAIALAVGQAGYKLGKDIALALDAAASEFYVAEKKSYVFKKSGGRVLSGDQMVAFYKELSKKYPIISIEDGCAENDWVTWKKLTDAIGDKVQIVGDDLFVTNTEFLKKGIDSGTANSILVKVNQIGTLTETLDAIEMAKEAGYTAVISHRSGRDRGRHDRRHRRRHERGPDQDGVPLPHRPGCEVQPAPAHRGGARRLRDLRREALELARAGQAGGAGASAPSPAGSSPPSAISSKASDSIWSTSDFGACFST